MPELTDTERIKRLRRTAKRLRKEIAESEERWRLLVAGAYSAFVAVDWRGRILEWNPAAERLFGWSAVEAKGREFTELLVPERLRAEHRADWRRLLDAGEMPPDIRGRIVPRLTKNGGEIIVEVRSWSVMIGGKPEAAAVMFRWEELAKGAF